jgi:hypothetical protein
VRKRDLAPRLLSRVYAAARRAAVGGTLATQPS